MTGFDKPNYTQVPNLLLDVLMADMTESELKIVLVAVRKIMGYHKDRDAISFSQFEEMSGLSRPAVQDGLNHALEHGWIIKADTGARNVGIYTLAIREDASLVKNFNQLKNTTGSSKKSLPMTGKKSLPTKETGNKRKEKNTPKSPKGDSRPRPQSAQGKRLQYWQENSEALEVIRHGLRPGLPVTVLNETDVKALIALHQDGERMAIPAARYPRLFAYLRRKFDWKANYVPTISDARKYIGEWWAIEKTTPVIVPQHPIQPAPERAKPGEIISREAQEEARRIFEDLVKLKDANG